MPGSHYQVPSSKFHHSTYSLTDSSENGPEDEEADSSPRLTPLQKLTTSMCKDENTIKELIIGRRVGFYKVRGEIGCGTFSRVKLAFHALTKGRWTFQTTQQYPGRGWAVMSANNIGKKEMDDLHTFVCRVQHKTKTETWTQSRPNSTESNRYCHFWEQRLDQKV